MAPPIPERLPEGSDPALANIPSFDSTVDLGDTCTVTLAYLRNLELRISYSHALMQRTSTYYMVAFKNNTKTNNPIGRLFISVDRYNEFESLLQKSGDTATFIVTSAFQYGQANKSGKDRFIVFHNPSFFYIHQNRFVSTALQKWGTMLSNAFGGDDAPGSVESMIRAMGMNSQDLRVWNKEN